jgi:KaiC/GvpD/RAD55 family RecA-like ATPase
MMNLNRLSTGIPHLDKKLQGGYPEGEALLITGEPGTGKTLFGIQFLHSACLSGKKCVMMATEETPEKIQVHAKMLGFDLEPYITNKQLSIMYLLEMRAADSGVNIGESQPLPIHIDDLNNFSHLIADDIEVVVIDNMGTCSIGMELRTFRDKLETLLYLLSKQKRTSIIIMDETAHEYTHRVAEYSTYGTIRLKVKENPYTGKMERFMYIPKMRGTKILLDLINYDISDEGIALLASQGKKDKPNC